MSVRSPSVTSTTTVPEKSSPHVYVVADSEDHAVSHVPSPLKSQRYWRESPSGSEDPDASSGTVVPSGTGLGTDSAAVGALLMIVVSFAFP
ncbi:MAG: hypothetical protein E6K13_00530 [Methanobacteriota archaeon]|nr:MAG: hypothetical protein E6K13_00530 [Euryarchaeota archaeon]